MLTLKHRRNRINLPLNQLQEILLRLPWPSHESNYLKYNIVSIISFPVKLGPWWRHGLNIVLKLTELGAQVFVMQSCMHAWRHFFYIAISEILVYLGGLARSSRLCDALWSLCAARLSLINNSMKMYAAIIMKGK